MVMPIIQYAPETCALCQGTGKYGDMGIIAWCAKGMEALWWPNPHVNAPNAREVVKILKANMLTVAKPAMGPVGPTC